MKVLQVLMRIFVSWPQKVGNRWFNPDFNSKGTSNSRDSMHNSCCSKFSAANFLIVGFKRAIGSSPFDSIDESTELLSISSSIDEDDWLVLAWNPFLSLRAVLSKSRLYYSSPAREDQNFNFNKYILWLSKKKKDQNIKRNKN